jgi:hypothetical protein
MTQTIINLGTGGAALNGRNGSTAGADSNDARFLDWPGDNAGNYVYLPGDAGNLLSAPDEAALDITGDIDLRAYVAADGWASANQTLVAKFTSTGNQQSYELRLASAGTIQMRWSENGSTILSATSTVATGLAAGSAKWVRATLDVDNGASGRDIQFFTSDDGVTWTQLGLTVTQAGVTSIYSGTAVFTVGVQSATLARFTGKVYRAQVLNGIGGTVVMDVDTSVITSGSATSFTALTGQTVTINRSTAGRKTVAVVSPVWLFGTDDYMEVANSPLLNPLSGEDFTVFIVHRMPSVTNAQAMVGTRTISTAATHPGWLIGTGTTAPFTYVDDGTNIASRSLATQYTAGPLGVSGFRLQGNDLGGFHNKAFTSLTSRPAGSQANTRPLRIGVRADTLAAYADMELVSVAVFRRALSNAEINLVTDYYQARLS